MVKASIRRLVLVLAVAAAVAASVAVVASGPAAAQPGGFSDVAEGAFYSVPVTSLAERGVLAGTECDEGFCPDVPLDRKTMAVWIVRVLDGEDPPTVTQTRFNDVDPDGFYASFVERMAELGVTSGCGDGSGYCPDATVTRAHMAVFLSRAYDLPEGPDPGFSDVAADAWFVTAVAKLAASGITSGCGDGTGFCPGGDTTRAQMATFLWRAINRVPDVLGTDCDFADHSDRVRSAVYQVRTDLGIGTAFYVGGDEWLTAAHVVDGVSSVTLHNGDAYLQATILGGNADADMAVLSASGSGIRALRFGRLQDAKAGEPLFAVGFPLFKVSEPSVARGVLSRTEVDPDLGTLIVTDASVNPGNSGGPLVDECGDVLGMVVSGWETYGGYIVDGINYAIAETTLQERMPAMRTGGPQSITVRKTYDECFADSTSGESSAWDTAWTEGTNGWLHVTWTPTASTTADSAGAFLDATSHDLYDHDGVIPQGCDFIPFLDVGCSTNPSDTHLWAGVWWSGLPVTGDRNAVVSVQYSFDGRTMVRGSWAPSFDADSSYLFGNAAVEFINDLGTSNSLSFTGQDDRGREAIRARFELNGVTDALAHLQDVCGWETPQPPVSQGGPDHSFTGEWTLGFDETDPLTRVRTLALAVAATDHTYPSTLEQDLYAAPQLFVVCASDGLWYMSIWWGGKYVADQAISYNPLTYGVPVSYRFDNSELRSATWQEGSPNEFTLTYDALSFWQEVWDSDQLVFRAWNFDSGVIGTATFNVSGFPAATQWLHDVCVFE